MVLIHQTVTKGDYIFAEWDDEDWKAFNKQVLELRKQGYRKVGTSDSFGYHNYHEHYKRKSKKKIITVTMMCC